MADVKADVHLCRGHCEGHFHVDAVLEPCGFLDRDQFDLIAHYADTYWFRGYRVIAVEPAGWLTPTITSEGVAVVFMEAHNP